MVTPAPFAGGGPGRASRFDPEEEAPVAGETASEKPRAESPAPHQFLKPLRIDHQRSVRLLQVSDPAAGLADEVPIPDHRPASENPGLRQADQGNRRVFANEETQVAGLGAGRKDPWLHNGDAAGSKMPRKIRKGGRKVPFGGEVGDRAKEAGHDVELPTQLERSHIASDEPDARESLPGDPQHLGTRVDPHAGVVPTKDLEVTTGSAGDVEPARSARPAEAMCHGLQSTSFGKVVLPGVLKIVVPRELVVHSEIP